MKKKKERKSKATIDPLILGLLKIEPMSKRELSAKLGYALDSLSKPLVRLVASAQVEIVPTLTVKGRPQDMCIYKLAPVGASDAVAYFSAEIPSVHHFGIGAWKCGAAQRDPLVAALFGPSQSNRNEAATC